MFSRRGYAPFRCLYRLKYIGRSLAAFSVLFSSLYIYAASAQPQAAADSVAQIAQSAPAENALNSGNQAAEAQAGGQQENGGESQAQAKSELSLEAHLSEGGPLLRQGVNWRIYGTNLGLDNKLPLIAQSSEAQPKLTLKPGEYIILAAFGRAEQSRNISLAAGQTAAESFNLNAGGLKLSAALLGGKINETQLHFAIYNEGPANEQKPLIGDAGSQEILRLPAGNYHIVCNYGSANATTRSDIRIEAGKLTEAVMQQRAAQLILKLVRQQGGEALADTSWAIMNDSGDIVREIANANAYIILAEGNYVAVARNKDQIYQKEFTISSGKDEEIEVLATPQNSVDENSID